MIDTHGVVTTVLGTSTAGCRTGDEFATASPLSDPSGLVFDAASGRLIVADGTCDIIAMNGNGSVDVLFSPE